MILMYWTNIKLQMLSSPVIILDILMSCFDSRDRIDVKRVQFLKAKIFVYGIPKAMSTSMC